MKAGRKLSVEGLYAAELGVTTRALKRAGGSAKVMALSEETRSLLLRKLPQPTAGGMNGLGMKPGVPGRFRSEGEGGELSCRMSLALTLRREER